MSDFPVRIASWIAGLMRENYEAVGFIPEPTVAEQYIANERYLLANDERGRRAGYLLHGEMRYGRTVSVAQHCIQDELRKNGYGLRAVNELIERATLAEVGGITLRCATDLESLGFWKSCGFQERDVVPGGVARDRKIARLWLPVSSPLFSSATGRDRAASDERSAGSHE